jgi:DNA (cytosine-5)-methyltransferase 1
MSKPRLLDAFCGAGGAAVGYHRAGFDVVGVDIEPQPRYPFEFWQDDALDVMGKLIAGRLFGVYRPFGIEDFEAIHASPPCQAYSDLAKRNGNGHQWPQLIEPVRELLQATGLPYVIENVEGAPLLDPVTLCGVAFPKLRVIRHRLFESNVELLALPHEPHPLVYTLDKRKRHYGRLDQATSYVQVTGGGNATVANKRDAMGIGWMTGRELNEAIPPAYAEHIGAQLLDHVRAAA